MSEGCIYVLLNPGLPGLVKVGRTTDDPRKRTRQLRTTGVPDPFALVDWWAVSNDVEAERAAHQALADYREAHDREFFRLAPSTAVRIVRQSIGPFLLPEEVVEYESRDEQSEHPQRLSIYYATQRRPEGVCYRRGLTLLSQSETQEALRSHFHNPAIQIEEFAELAAQFDIRDTTSDPEFAAAAAAELGTFALGLPWSEFFDPQEVAGIINRDFHESIWQLAVNSGRLSKCRQDEQASAEDALRQERERQRLMRLRLGLIDPTDL